VPDTPEVVGHYSAHYADFASQVYADTRRDAFGEDIGQNSWLTREELDGFIRLLDIAPSSRLLDVASGSGGPSLYVARATGCEVVGLDVHEEAVASGSRLAQEAGLDRRASFVQADAGEPLPFGGDLFDAVLCIDAINHFRGRVGVFAEWARVLRPGGRVLFTDPATVTGPLDSDEIARRSSIGYFLFMPPGKNERLLAEAGLNVLAVEDTTAAMAHVARRRHEARVNRASALKELEGAEAFEGRQRFFETAALLAREGRLSRLVYLATKPRR